MNGKNFIDLAQNYVKKHHKTKLPQEYEDLISETTTFILQNGITSIPELEKTYGKEIKKYLYDKVLKFRREETIGESGADQTSEFEDDRTDDEILSIKSRKAISAESDIFGEELEKSHQRVNKVIFSNISHENEKYYSEYETNLKLKYKKLLPPVLFEAYERIFYPRSADICFTNGFEKSALLVLAKRARIRIQFSELEQE